MIDKTQVPKAWIYKGTFRIKVRDNLSEISSWWHHALIEDFMVLRSIAIMKDRSQWIHLVVSRKDRFPTTLELFKAKDAFIGEDKEAYQLLPPSVNPTDSRMAHLWHPLDEKTKIVDLFNIIEEMPF